MDYQVFTYKTDAMKKLQQLAARGGYNRYANGTIETKKVELLLSKFEDRYRINANKNQRYYAKTKGEANTDVVLLLDGDNIHFWLMVSPGDGLVCEAEKLHELINKKHRLVVTGYELVRVQKQDRVSWTWRLTKENYGEWERRIIDACKHKNDDHIRQIQYSLERMPVFSAMRQQAFDLHKLLSKTYKRHFDHAYETPLHKNFYGRYKAAKTLSAADLGKKARRLHIKHKNTVESDSESSGVNLETGQLSPIELMLKKHSNIIRLKNKRKDLREQLRWLKDRDPTSTELKLIKQEIISLSNEIEQLESN